MKHIRAIKSIYTKLTLLLVLAAVISLTFFGIVLYASVTAADSYYDSASVTNKMELKYARSLQRYVKKNNLKSTDTKAINRWVDQHSMLSMWVTKKGEVVYNSDTDQYDEDYSGSADTSRRNRPLYITFADGKTEVFFFCDVDRHSVSDHRSSGRPSEDAPHPGSGAGSESAAQRQPGPRDPGPGG